MNETREFRRWTRLISPMRPLFGSAEHIERIDCLVRHIALQQELQSDTLHEIVALVDERLAKNRAAGLLHKHLFPEKEPCISPASRACPPGRTLRKMIGKREGTMDPIIDLIRHTAISISGVNVLPNCLKGATEGEQIRKIHGLIELAENHLQYGAGRRQGIRR